MSDDLTDSTTPSPLGPGVPPLPADSSSTPPANAPVPHDDEEDEDDNLAAEDETPHDQREGIPAPVDVMMLACYDGYLNSTDDKLSSVTKLGGTPTAASHVAETPQWRALLASRVCRKCGGRLFLVAQCYCPLSDTHHRMLYVFGCNRSDCARFPLESWVAFSLQVEGDDPAAAEEDEPELQTSPEPVGPLTRLQFPPVATYTMEEPEKEHIEPSTIEKEMARMVEANDARSEEIKSKIREADLANLDENVDLRNKATDRYYERFRRRVARAPTQVLRYQPNGQPIFMNVEKTIYVDIPPCPVCGGLLTMELQIMPTAVYYLRADACAADPKKEGFDFATVTVYTCAQQCQAGAPGVVLTRPFVLVEPAPSREDEEESRGGKMTLRETITGQQQAGSGPSGPRT